MPNIYNRLGVEREKIIKIEFFLFSAEYPKPFYRAIITHLLIRSHAGKNYEGG